MSETTRSGSYSGLSNEEIKTFSQDHKELIAKVQAMRKDLADWRAAADKRTSFYTDTLEALQDELLQSMQQLQEEVSAMRSKVREELRKHEAEKIVDDDGCLGSL